MDTQDQVNESKDGDEIVAGDESLSPATSENNPEVGNGRVASTDIAADAGNEIVAGVESLPQATSENNHEVGNGRVASTDIETDVDNGTNNGNEAGAARWKRLKKHVRRPRQGSVLHRNDNRTDYLRKLHLKSQIAERKLQNLANSISGSLPHPLLRRATSIDAAQSSKIDASFMAECTAEVDQEMDDAKISAKLKEIHEMSKEYTKYFAGLGVFPLEVRLQNVSYIVPVDVSSSKIRTVYNTSFLYSLAKFCRRILRGEAKPVQNIIQFPVLKNINLVLRPGKQYLVLGAPGSGKSSLLKLIAGLIKPKTNEKLDGNIEYNGRTMKEKEEFHIENAIAYIDQLDKHPPRLTVEETFEFAYQCLTGGRFIREKLEGEAKIAAENAEKEHLSTRIMLASLGLTEVANTYVGNTSIRGVSGGQRRRVTVGEMLASHAPVLCGDEISTGLDAASTYDMVQVILHAARRRQETNVFSLLQPSPETVSLFDEVIVLAEGQILFAGPINEVEDYFADIGYKSPQFTDVADFLQIVSTEDGAELYDPPTTMNRDKQDAPTVNELVAMFQASEFGVEISELLQKPSRYIWKAGDGMCPEEGQVSDLSMSELVRRRYANRFHRSVQLITKRFLILWIRDKRVIIAGFVKNVLMGVSVGGVFLNSDDSISIQGCLFQAGLFIMLGAMQSSAGLIEDRVIFYKHADANFYSAWPFVIGRVMAQIPQTTFDTLTFGTILYYMVGLGVRTEFSNFLVYISTLMVFSLLMNQQMAVFASFANGGDMQVYGACTLLLGMLFGGFIVPPSSIPFYYVWIYWWNPFAWAYRSLILNEFLTPQWPDSNQILVSNGFVNHKDEAFGDAWIGYGYYYMLIYFGLCCVGSALGLTFVRNTGKQAPEPKNDTYDTEPEQVDAIHIPFTPVTLSFHDISYEVTASTSSEKLMLLHSVNGIFRPGEMCALMGSSGAGKTTLMDVIALRKRTGTITGSICLNGWPQEPASFRRCSGYVEQFDVQSPELTVKETVLFSARLRLDPDLVASDEDKVAFVDRVLSDVELTDLQDALVGTDDTEGLSFEQKKRLSIAVELAASPSIIFLDEPTSGLDARSASLVVKALRKIADGGRTICATIHQPSSAVFGMFDTLLLLKRGGKVVYNGKLGKDCETLVSYYESRGAPNIALGENPANWMHRLITSDEMSTLDDVYLKSPDFEALKEEIEQIKTAPQPQMKISYDSEFASSAGRRRELVNGRLVLIYWRSPAYNRSRIIVSLVIAFLLSSVFFAGYNLVVLQEVDMRSRLSVVFLSFIILGIMAILSVIPVMEKIRDCFYRHRDAGMYDSASLGLALGVAEKYFILMSTTLFCVVMLSTSNINQGVHGLIGFWGYFTFNFAIYSYVGQLFVCLVSSTGTAVILSSVFIGLNNFFAGLIVRPQYMVGTFYALPYYISPSHYVYESLVMALYSKDTRQVEADVGSDFYDYLVTNNVCTGTPCYGTVTEYVNVFFDFNFSADNNTRNAIILGFVLVLTRLLTWVALKKIR